MSSIKKVNQKLFKMIRATNPGIIISSLFFLLLMSNTINIKVVVCVGAASGVKHGHHRESRGSSKGINSHVLRRRQKHQEQEQQQQQQQLRRELPSSKRESTGQPIHGKNGGLDTHDDCGNRQRMQQHQQHQQDHQHQQQRQQGGCTTEQLTIKARTSVEDQYFTYSGSGRLDFNDDQSFVSDILQLAVFASYRDEILCIGDGSTLQLVSSFLMFGYDHQMMVATKDPDTIVQHLDHRQQEPVFNHSFFLMTFNMACNVCPIANNDDCGIPVFVDDDVTPTSRSTEMDAGCSCYPPARQTFLRNLNERLQQHPDGLFDGIIVDSVSPIVVTPERSSFLLSSPTTTMVSRSSNGIGQDAPIRVRSVP
jgi:hypothetical protein